MMARIALFLQRLVPVLVVERSGVGSPKCRADSLWSRILNKFSSADSLALQCNLLSSKWLGARKQVASSNTFKPPSCSSNVSSMFSYASR